MIAVQGNVTAVAGNAPIIGAKVIAFQEGTEIQQETDNNGNFLLNLVPGHWRISVRARGFNEPDAYMYNFTADATGIDFQLQEGYTISGLIISGESGKPAPGVVVEAKAKINDKTVTKQRLTDPSGEYRFSSLQPGEWEVQGSSDERQTNKEVLTIGPDASNVGLTISRRMDKSDWNWGRGFFVVLCFLLGALIGIYIWAHEGFKPEPEPVVLALIDQVERAGQDAAAVTETTELSDPSRQPLLATVRSLKEDWDSVSNTINSITQGQIEQVNLLISRVETAATTDQTEDLQNVQSALSLLKAALENPHSIYFWSDPPGSYLEVLFWSLAGILVSLLITSGYYLRRKRFYKEGVWMHVSHLLSVPLLAIVVIFLMSQITLTVQIDESVAVLDINDPRLLAALSFIVAVRPWTMLEFVREAGSRFFSQVQRRIAGNGDNQQ